MPLNDSCSRAEIESILKNFKAAHDFCLVELVKFKFKLNKLPYRRHFEENFIPIKIPFLPYDNTTCNFEQNAFE